MVAANNKKGFTIIEVVLVLAIAGLIFLMVFIALPALQRNQRDSQRRSDVSKFIAQLNQYAVNNRNQVPQANTAAMNKFLDSYMKRGDGEFKDPKSGNNYTVEFSGDPTTEKLIYRTSAKCDNEDIVSLPGSPRSVAARIQLEGSGFFCKDNQ